MQPSNLVIRALPNTAYSQFGSTMINPELVDGAQGMLSIDAPKSAKPSQWVRHRIHWIVTSPDACGIRGNSANPNEFYASGLDEDRRFWQALWDRNTGDFKAARFDYQLRKNDVAVAPCIFNDRSKQIDTVNPLLINERDLSNFGYRLSSDPTQFTNESILPEQEVLSYHVHTPSKDRKPPSSTRFTYQDSDIKNRRF